MRNSNPYKSYEQKSEVMSLPSDPLISTALSFKYEQYLSNLWGELYPNICDIK